MGDLSPHFSAREFADRVTGAVYVEQPLLDALERLRAICGGRPLRIVSGYRSPATNRAVGGASRSQHMYGRAADIPYGYATVDQARRAGFTGIGSKGNYATHVDVRPGTRVARWSYG